MVKKDKVLNKKSIAHIDLLFISIIFLLPLISRVVFKTSNINPNVFFVLILACWGIIKVCFSKLILKKVLWFDIGVFILAFYIFFHFILYSEASYYYYELWVYVGYIFIFYMLRAALRVNKFSALFISKVLYIIIIVGFLESITALLQYFEIITGKNKFFLLLGSFSSPNFLGAYLGLSFITLLWVFLVRKSITKRAHIIGVLAFFMLLLSVIILSNSRGSWVAIIGSILTLLLTSKKIKQLIIKVSLPRKIIFALGLIFCLIFSAKFLYNLKPESINGRMLVAKISLQEIAKQPIKGHGLFSFSGHYNKAKANYFEESERSWEDIRIGTYAFSSLNDYILITFELGILVLIFAVLLLLFLILKIKINNETRLGLALLINVCLFALFNTALNNIPLMLISFLGLALILTYGGFNTKIVIPFTVHRYIIKSLILTVFALGIYVSIYKISNKNKVKSFSFKDNSLKEFIYISNALEDNIFSEYIIGEKLYHANYKDKGKKHMEHAFKYSSAPIIGRNLAYIYLKENNFKRAEEIFTFNKYVEPYRYEARMDLLGLMERAHEVEALLKMAQEIISLPIKIPSDKVTKYKEIAAQKIETYSKLSVPKKGLKGNLSKEKLIESQILKKVLPYKVYSPPIHKIDKKLPVIYINDGYGYIKQGKLPKLLDNLILKGKIEPVIAVFLNPTDINENSKNIRQELFLCNPLFKAFFINELLPTIENLYPVSNKREDRSILGLSFGGLAALYLADQAPDYFKNIIMQSPAFHPCPTIYKSYKNKPKKDFNIYMSYGTGEDTENQDIPMIEIMRNKGYNLKVECVKDGDHEWEVWKEQLSDILIHFFN